MLGVTQQLAINLVISTTCCMAYCKYPHRPWPIHDVDNTLVIWPCNSDVCKKIPLVFRLYLENLARVTFQTQRILWNLAKLQRNPFWTLTKSPGWNLLRHLTFMSLRMTSPLLQLQQLLHLLPLLSLLVQALQLQLACLSRYWGF